jgi:hypothetical protein
MTKRVRLVALGAVSRTGRRAPGLFWRFCLCTGGTPSTTGCPVSIPHASNRAHPSTCATLRVAPPHGRQLLLRAIAARRGTPGAAEGEEDGARSATGRSTDRPDPPWEEHRRTLCTAATSTSTGERVRGGRWLAGGGRKEGGGAVAEAIAGTRTLLGGATARSEPTRPALLRGRSREGGGACPGRVLRGRRRGRLGPPHRHEGNPPPPLRLPPTRSRLGRRLLPHRRPCPSVWRQLRRRGGCGARAAGRGRGGGGAHAARMGREGRLAEGARRLPA